MTIAAVYCRVSTEDQEREGTSLDTQEALCLEKAAQIGYDVPAEFIFREAASGLTTNRPRLTELRAAAAVAGKFKAIIVLKPDRLARNGEDILSLFKEFKIGGVKLVFVKEEFEDSPAGKMLAFAMGWAAEMYVHATKEATKRGKAARMAEGKIAQGTGPGIYGYTWDKLNKQRVIDEAQAAVVRGIFDLISQGKDCFTVAKEINGRGIPALKGGPWHARTIRNVATNPAYMGVTYYGRTHREGKKTIRLPESEWKTIAGATPPIVSPAAFKAAQDALQRPKGRTGKLKYAPYLLTGFLRCGECGSPIVGGAMDRGRYRYYRCRGTFPRETGDTAICRARYIKADETDAAVWAQVKEILKHPDVHAAILKRKMDAAKDAGSIESLEKTIKKLEGQLRAFGGQHQRLMSLFSKFSTGEIDTSDALLDQINQVKKDREKAEKDLATARYALEQLREMEQVELQLPAFCAQILPNIENATFEDKRAALSLLKFAGTVTNGHVDGETIIPFRIQSKATHHWTNIGITT
ncbi:Site-specific recombinase [Dehalogenimonas alkenigignens]|uniref:Site-specific recombinase n=1 Tax=Dehalogenimonas alkenigignens TaxID=1217799 RepID=A0A0W0GHU1_9CHLR|nr:recombinase family protein [Dehalogenimonas alkenigignens]KTB48135.1 Site-specific recombinase [Dehalogenimonas alkenigignens]